MAFVLHMDARQVDELTVEEFSRYAEFLAEWHEAQRKAASR